MSATGVPTASQRPIALAPIVLDGVVSLPVAAALLDGESTWSWWSSARWSAFSCPVSPA